MAINQLTSQDPQDFGESSRQAFRCNLRKEITRLKAKLSLLGDLQLRHASLSRPVNQLPLEILGEIFLLVSPAPIRDYDDREELLDLGLVCKRWRCASLATKKLWSGAYIDYCDTEYERIAAWLGRSNGFRKKVEFVALPDPETCGECSRCPCLPETNRKEECRALSTTLVRLLAEGPRLVHLTLDLDSTGCYRNFRDALHRHCKKTGTQSHWDELQSFDLRMVHASVDVDDLWEELFADLPSANLKSLRLDLPSINTFNLSNFDEDELGYLPFGVNTSLHIPQAILEQLTSFSIKYNWGSTHVFDAIQHCSENLEVLAIDVSPDTPEIFADWWEMRDFMKGLSIEPIVFKKLHTLDIRNADPNHPDNYYLSCLKTPNLRHLTLVGRSTEIIYRSELEEEGDPIMAYPVTSFLQQNAAGSSLLTMHLENIPHEDARISYLAKNHPLLESVTLPGTWSLKTYSKVWRKFRSMKRLEIMAVPVALPVLSQVLGAEWAGVREQRNIPPCELMVSYARPAWEGLERMCERMGRAEMEDARKLVVRF